MTPSTRHRRPRTRQQKQADAAFLAWVEFTMGDNVPAPRARDIVGMHAALIRWIQDAEHATLTPAPQRRHPFDDRDATRGAHITGTRDPDTWMVGLVVRWMHVGHDPEQLHPTRHRLTHELGRTAGWYLDKTGTVLPERWEPLAVRLGDMIGDQVAANALATSLLGHHHLAIIAPERSRGICHAARQRWTRLAAFYVRTLDGQPIPEPRRAPLQHIGTDDIRRFG